MKKASSILFGMAITLFITQSAFADGVISQTGADATAKAGQPVNVTGTTGPTIDPFSVSTNVVMEGATSATSFALTGYHLQVDQKKSGKMFAMASDSSAMWFADISSTAASTYVVGTGTNSGDLNAAYEKM